MGLPFLGGGPQIYDFGPSSLCLWGNLGPGLKKLVLNAKDIRERKFLPQWSEASLGLSMTMLPASCSARYVAVIHLKQTSWGRFYFSLCLLGKCNLGPGK